MSDITLGREPQSDRRPSTAVLVVLLLAVAFGFGSVGFAIGQRKEAPPPADVGFLRDMIIHHEQAVEMSKIVIGQSLPAGGQSFVVEVISDQRYEIGLMETTLRRWGAATEEPSGIAMAWMGESMKADAMPGMATPAELEALAELAGDRAAERWFQLMTVHHQGGIAMAEAAVERVQDPEVRSLAERVARNQRIEINEYASAAKRLGLAAPITAEHADRPAAAHGGHP